MGILNLFAQNLVILVGMGADMSVKFGPGGEASTVLLRYPLRRKEKRRYSFPLST